MPAIDSGAELKCMLRKRSAPFLLANSSRSRRSVFLSLELEDFLGPEGHIESRGLFIHPHPLVLRARVDPAMAGIEHDNLGRRRRQLGQVVGGAEERGD